jgi:hypothetical protein
MALSEIHIAGELYQFIREYADDRCCLELLRFLGRYPNARFSRLTLGRALDTNGRGLYIGRALVHLIDKGVVKTYIGNNVCLYSLTRDEPLRSLALDLGKLDWRQWQFALRRIYPTE